MINRFRLWLLLIIVITGALLRFTMASNCCVIWDERINDFPPARQISFDFKNPHFPLVDTRPEGINKGTSPMAGKYLIHLGWDIFGDTVLGARLPFVMIATITILFVYFVACQFFGVEVGLLSAGLLSVSQFCITTSSMADPTNALTRFLGLLSLYMFIIALKKSDGKILLFNGVIVGISYWVKENMVFLLPIQIIFLLISRHCRAWLKNPYIWGSMFVAFLIMLPNIILTSHPTVPRFRYILNEATIGFSLNAVGLYLGEIILLATRPFPDVFNSIANSVDNEYTMVNGLLGIVILIAVVWNIREKNDFLRLLITCFLFNFILFSFLRRNDIIQSFWSLGSLDWSALNFLPGVILAAHMLVVVTKRHKKVGVIFCLSLLVFMFVRAINIVSYPLNAFFPKRQYLFQKDYFIGEAQDMIRLGDYIYAKDMLKKIYRVTKKDQAVGLLNDIAILEREPWVKPREAKK